MILCMWFFTVPVYAKQIENDDVSIQDTETIEDEEIDDTEDEEKVRVINFKNSGYKVKLKENTTFTYTGKSLKPEIYVIRKGVKIPQIAEDGSVNYTISYKNNKNAGTATIVVKGKGRYTDTIQTTFKIVPGTTKVSTSTAEKNIFLSWDKVTGASGYKIYRSLSKDSGYKLIDTISSEKTRNYTDKNTIYYRTYYYKIRAYRTVNGKNIYGEYSNPVKNQIASMSAKVEAVSSNTLKVSWEKLNNALGYLVYRSTSKSGEYKQIANIDNASTTFYNDSSIKVGVKYYYKVRAYNVIRDEKCYSAYSNVVSKNTLPDQVVIKEESTYASDKVTLKWEKHSYASGYEIYRATSENEKYTKVKTIKNPSTVRWTQSKLDTEKEYYYKIRAFCTVNGKNIYGDFSNVYTKLRIDSGWKYENGYKLYYDEEGKLVTDVRNIIGPQSSYVIKINKKQGCVTVYAQDGANGYILPVTAFICSAGYDTPIGTFYTFAKYRWHELIGPSWGQWDTRIVGGILFHSVYYTKANNNMALSVSAYNKLGTIASHGCIRLVAEDAKWIYDNCALNTKVIIYDSDDPGPLGKPTAHILPTWHTWDPTDPTANYKCKEMGCH